VAECQIQIEKSRLKAVIIRLERLYYQQKSIHEPTPFSGIYLKDELDEYRDSVSGFWRFKDTIMILLNRALIDCKPGHFASIFLFYLDLTSLNLI